MAESNQSYMAKSKRKTDYIQELHELIDLYTEKLTVKQIRQLLAKYALS